MPDALLTQVPSAGYGAPRSDLTELNSSQLYSIKFLSDNSIRRVHSSHFSFLPRFILNPLPWCRGRASLPQWSPSLCPFTVWLGRDQEWTGKG